MPKKLYYRRPGEVLKDPQKKVKAKYQGGATTDAMKVLEGLNKKYKNPPVKKMGWKGGKTKLVYGEIEGEKTPAEMKADRMTKKTLKMLKKRRK